MDILLLRKETGSTHSFSQKMLYHLFTFQKDINLFKFNKQSNETLTQNSHDDIENIADTDTFVSHRMPRGPSPGPDS